MTAGAVVLVGVLGIVLIFGIAVAVRVVLSRMDEE